MPECRSNAIKNYEAGTLLPRFSQNLLPPGGRGKLRELLGYWTESGRGPSFEARQAQSLARDQESEFRDRASRAF